MYLIKRGLLVGLLFLGVTLSGCVPTGESFSPVKDLTNDKAAIYLYRPYNLVGGGRMYTVFVDNQQVGKLVNGAYRDLLVSPGTHKVELKQDSLLIKGYEFEITVKTAASKISYLRFGSAWAGGKAGLTQVDSAVAKPELEKCKKY